MRLGGVSMRWFVILSFLLAICTAEANEDLYFNPWAAVPYHQGYYYSPGYSIRKQLADFVISNPFPVLLLAATGAIGFIGVNILLQGDKLNNQRDRISSNADNLRNVCNQLRGLLMITNPEYDQDTAQNTPAPSPNAVSTRINAFGGWPVSPITSGSAYVADPLFAPTGDLDIIASESLGTGPTGTALSIADFNDFRRAVVDMINILDTKIREMVRVTPPECP